MKLSNHKCLLAAVLMASGLLAFTGCESTSSAKRTISQGTPTCGIEYYKALEYARFMALGINGHASPVSGTSMMPAMGDGSVAIVEFSPWNTLQVGDWIQFWVGGERWIHAISWIEGDRAQTQGLNNDSPDPFILQRDHYLGRVAGVVYSRDSYAYNSPPYTSLLGEIE